MTVKIQEGRCYGRAPHGRSEGSQPRTSSQPRAPAPGGDVLLTSLAVKAGGDGEVVAVGDGAAGPAEPLTGRSGNALAEGLTGSALQGWGVGSEGPVTGVRGLRVTPSSQTQGTMRFSGAIEPTAQGANRNALSTHASAGPSGATPVPRQRRPPAGERGWGGGPSARSARRPLK